MVATAVEGLGEIHASGIRVLNRNGNGMAEVSSQVLQNGGITALPPERFVPWTEVSVKGQLAELHNRMTRLLDEVKL